MSPRKFSITIVCNITVHTREESPPYSSLVIFRLKHVIRQRCVSRHYFYPPSLIILSSLSVIINRIANKPVLITTATPWDNATRTLGATNDPKCNLKPTEYRRTFSTNLVHVLVYRVFVVHDYRSLFIRITNDSLSIKRIRRFHITGLWTTKPNVVLHGVHVRMSIEYAPKKNQKDLKQNILYTFKPCNETNIKLEKNTVLDVWKKMSRQRSNFDLIYLSNFLNLHTYTHTHI